jgi:hypothetical protein
MFFYDPVVLMTFNRTVTRIERMFPHGRVYVDVARANGRAKTWTFETANPTQFINRGVGRNFLRTGDEVSITAWVAKKQIHLASARTLTLSDGRSVDVGDRWNPFDMGKK